MFKLPITVIVLTIGLLMGHSLVHAGALLADALENQSLANLPSLLQQGAEPDETQPDGPPPLMWAAESTAQNRYGIQAIHLACLNGDLQTTRLLLQAGASANFQLPGGESALHTAARSGNHRLVGLLIRAGAVVDHQIAGGQTALMWAASEGHAEAVNLLLEAGADPLAKSQHGFTAIHFAARSGHQGVIEHLLKAGIDVNLPLEWTGPGGFRSPRKQSSPLILAIENAEFELAVFLLEQGADANDMRTGYAPLHTMTWVRKAHLGDSSDPEPPIHGNMSSTQFLIELIRHGADLDFQLRHGLSSAGRVAEKGATPFFLAADRGDLEMMKLLVQHGADPHIPNIDGVTPLMVAAGLGRGPENDEAGTQKEALAAVAYCIELGMDVNAVDVNGETAMHGAAYGQWPEMVHFLDSQSADINIWNTLNDYKWSPLLIAQGYRRGNFKPSYDTIAAIEAVMSEHGVTLRYDPPAEVVGYD